MIVETPSILWNCEDYSKGTPAALTSIDLCESGIILNNNNNNNNNNSNRRSSSSYVLATASSSNILNLWRITIAEIPPSTNPSTTSSSSSSPVAVAASTVSSTQGLATSSSSTTATKIEHLCSLSRHDGPINIVRFSPDGLQLVSGGENGTIIIWSVPVQYRLNNNGRHYWTTVCNESDLLYKVTPRCCSDGICDLSWSIDSKRILLGTIDHTIVCLEDESYDYNHSLTNNNNNNNTFTTTEAVTLPITQQQQIQSEWKVVYRNSTEHTHYVQGVSYDPLGLYFASMSCDRTVRILQRRPPRRSNTKKNNDSKNEITIQEQLTTSRLEMISNKARQIKFRKTINTTNNSNTNNNNDGTSILKQHLFNDESTLESFVRRLSWTIDGAFLITPAALWHKTATTNDNSSSSSNGNSYNNTVDTETTIDSKSKTQQQQQQHQAQQPAVHYATLMFARHRFDEPYRVLGGLDKPSIAVRTNPVLFTIPEMSIDNNDKENEVPIAATRQQQNISNRKSLPYRSIFAVLTLDSVLIYDTYHKKPLSIIRGIHYANIVDATWTSDGHSLLVCSTDCFITIIRFAFGELGQVYTKPESINVQSAPAVAAVSTKMKTTTVSSPTIGTVPNVSPETSSPQTVVRLPPCEPGPINSVIAPPTKRAKTRIAPTLIATPIQTISSTPINDNKKSSSSFTSPSTILPSKRLAPSPTTQEKQITKKELEDSESDVFPPTDAVDKLSLSGDNGENTVKEDMVTSPNTIINQPPNKKQKKRIQPFLMAKPLLQQQG